MRQCLPPPSFSMHKQDAAAANTAAKRANGRRKLVLDDARAHDRVRRSTYEESAAFLALKELEQEIDAVTHREHVDHIECVRKYERVKKTVRVYVFHTTREDGEGYTLHVVGRVVSPRREDPERGGSADGDIERGERRFSQFIRQMDISIDGTQRCSWLLHKSIGAKDGFELRGTFGAGSGGVADANVKLWLNHEPEIFSVAPDLARMVGSLFSTRGKLIGDLWGYCAVNRLISQEDSCEVRVDDSLLALLSSDGFPVPANKRVNFQALCEYVCAKKITVIPPIELKYKIRVGSTAPSKPDCYDIDMDVPNKHQNPTGPWLDKHNFGRDIDTLHGRIRTAMMHIDAHKARREYLLRFAESPVDFINTCVRQQAKGIYTPSIEGSDPARPSDRAPDTFKEPWVDEAVLRYLNQTKENE